MAWMADGKRFKHSRRVGSRVLTSYFPGPFGAEVAEQVAECLVDGIVKRDMVVTGCLDRHVLLWKLVGVKGDDIDAGVMELSTKKVGRKEILQDVIGVAAEAKLGEYRRHPGTRTGQVSRGMRGQG